MPKLVYPAGGWLSPGTPVNWQRKDQGQDFVIPWQHELQAPGQGQCVAVGSDAPFPSGFGPDYAIVRIDTGAWRGHEWYLGHCSSLVSAGEPVHFGQPVARADQGQNFNGTSGGWVELGERLPDGSLGPNSSSGHWYDHLFNDLAVNVPDPVLHEGSVGKDVWLLTWRLVVCGYLPHPGLVFNRHVKEQVQRFQRKHKLAVSGIVGSGTWLRVKYVAEACRRLHTKDV